MQNGEPAHKIAEEVEAETYIWKDSITELEEKEWDFEEFKRDKMKFWMGDSGEEQSNVEVDEGFADVDKAIATEKGKDEMGGRGVNGAIGRQLESVR